MGRRTDEWGRIRRRGKSDLEKLTDSEGGNKKLYGNKKEGEIRFRKTHGFWNWKRGRFLGGKKINNCHQNNMDKVNLFEG